MSISIYQESALKRHEFKVASLRDAAQTMFLSPHYAVFGVAPFGRDTVQNCLYGVIEIQLLRGCGDGNQSEILNCRIIQNVRTTNEGVAMSGQLFGQVADGPNVGCPVAG